MVIMPKSKLVLRLKTIGVAGLFHSVFRRVVARPIASFNVCGGLIAGASGLEIGGPSPIFARHGLFPAYTIAANVDNCNFSASTIWQGALEGGASFQYDKNRPSGNQYFLEATDLKGIAANCYDFALSSHVLEHVANPLLALSEWIRVVKPGGTLVLVVPHKAGSFDHRRAVTTLEHMIADLEQGTTEADMTHVAEILDLHDLSRDPEAGGIEAFRERAADNLRNRGLHHHVFDTALAVALVDYFGLQILAVEVARPYNIFVVAQKLNNGHSPNNASYLGNQAKYRRTSPFLTDRQPAVRTAR
jgi:SAM-dependent methyltransferase